MELSGQRADPGRKRGFQVQVDVLETRVPGERAGVHLGVGDEGELKGVLVRDGGLACPVVAVDAGRALVELDVGDHG